MWKNKGASLDLSKKDSPEYADLAKMYWPSGESDNTVKKILIQRQKMIYATTTYNNGSHPHKVKDGHVGIVEHGSVNLDLQDGYNTTWWHYKYSEDGKIDEGELQRSCAIGIRLICGNFSYAEIPNTEAYNQLLGVTGTLTRLGIRQLRK